MDQHVLSADRIWHAFSLKTKMFSYALEHSTLITIISIINNKVFGHNTAYSVITSFKCRI